MWRLHALRALLGLGLVSCGAPPGSVGFAAAGDGLEITGELATGSTGSTSSTSSTTSTTSTSTTTAANDSTTSTTAGTTTSSPDLPDFGDIGCGGKVDFLFILSNQETMEPVASQMKEALPAFIDTIRSRFADFDNQIMVMDANGTWGSSVCQGCSETCEAGPPEYPCTPISQLEDCDLVEGAGVTFPVGHGTQNKRCELVGGHRYMLASDPTPEETFLCLASVGYDGGSNAPVEVMLAALDNTLTGPSGCNEGFLRDDALLVVVIIADFYDYSDGEPATWKAKLLAAKGNDPDALVLLAITTDMDLEEHLCLPWEETLLEENRLRTLVDLMDHGLISSICAPTWAPFFEQASDLVLEQCQVFVPQ